MGCTCLASMCTTGSRLPTSDSRIRRVGRSTFYCCQKDSMSCQNLTDIDEVGQDVLDQSDLHHPVQEIIENPAIPYSGPIPVLLKPGRVIAISGCVTPEADRFAIDLTCGPNALDDTAFHFNPRFNERYVVRNSRINDRWGEEEDSVPQKCPFERGETFDLVIFVTEEQFMVSVNSRHFCQYTFRVQLGSIDILSISGDLTVSKIEHRRDAIYPFDSLQRTHLFNKITSNTVEDDNTNLLEAPYIGVLTEPFSLGKELEIIGRVKLLPQSFYVNLQKGQQNWPHPIIYLHLTPHFLVRSNSVARVVCNSWISKKWGPEETSKRSPFHPGESFILNVRYEQDHFSISVDGAPMTNYKHRSTPESIDTVVIEGDVLIKSIATR